MRLVARGRRVAGVCIAAGVADKAEFFRSYLIAFLFWIGITLGSLALLMVQHLTGGRWALVIRRILEAGTPHASADGRRGAAASGGNEDALQSGRARARPIRSILAKHSYLNPQFFIGAHGFLFRGLVHCSRIS